MGLTGVESGVVTGIVVVLLLVLVRVSVHGWLSVRVSLCLVCLVL